LYRVLFYAQFKVGLGEEPGSSGSAVHLGASLLSLPGSEGMEFLDSKGWAWEMFSEGERMRIVHIVGSVYIRKVFLVNPEITTQACRVASQLCASASGVRTA
jgi:hypothetical protein